MTTQQAALLAAVGRTLQILMGVVLPLLTFVLSFGWRHPHDVVRALPMYFVGLVWQSALPVFFICVYLSAPPLVIPEQLRRPTLMAAIATGLSAALTIFDQLGTVVSLWNDGYAYFQAGDLVRRLGQFPLLGGPIWVFAAITVPAFFLVLMRSEAGDQSVSPALMMAAVYAGLAMMASVAYGLYSRVSNEIFMWTHQALLAQSGRLPGAGLWYRILQTSLGLFYSGSLAWFFFLFYKKVATTQSSQRLSSGE